MKRILKNALLAISAVVCMTGCRSIAGDGAKGDKGAQGSEGLPGKDGADAKTPYEQYIELHPEYSGDEKQWYQDLANGKLADDDYSIMDGFMMIKTAADEYIIGGYLGSETDIVIPDTYQGKPIIGIGRSAFTEMPIEKVKLGKNVTTIGYSAFESCKDLAEVLLPEGLISVGQNAFYLNTSLTSISLPSTVRTVEAYAFQKSAIAGDLVLPDGLKFIGNQAFDSSKIEHVSFGSDELEIESGAFSKTPLSGDLEIPSQVKLIGSEIFANTGVSSVEFIDSDGSNIGLYGTFSNCTSLVSLALPEGCRSVPDRYCYYCTSLTNLSIPSGVVEIGVSAFYGANIDSLVLPMGLKKIDQQAFKSTNIASLSLPEGLEYIGYAAFSTINKLVEITFPTTITFIDDSAFTTCSNLRKISYAGPLKGKLNIGRLAFFRCAKLVDVEIPDGTVCLGESAFYMAGRSEGLNDLRIPGSVQVIQSRAFYESAFSGDIIIEHGVSVIEAGAFTYIWNPAFEAINVYIPSSVGIIGDLAFMTKDYVYPMNVYCEAPAKPSGWSDNWVPNGAYHINVTWGCHF